MSLVSVVIPNLNGKEYLRDCLDSLLQQDMGETELIVIDNGSNDGSAAMVREQYPGVILKCFSENTGFCHAVNTGIAMSHAPYVILLNNDTKADRGFVRALYSAMQKHPRAFSAGAVMLQMKDPALVDDAGDFYSALGWAFARGKGKRAERYRTQKRVFSCCGGATIYRKSILEKIGGFDERFFAYLEDVDIGFRARLWGYENWFVPSARVLHAGSASSGARYNAFKVRHTSRNNFLLMQNNFSMLQMVINAPLVFLGWLIKAFFFAARGLLRPYLQGSAAGVSQLLQKRPGKGNVPEGRRIFQRMQIQLELWINVIFRLFA